MTPSRAVSSIPFLVSCALLGACTERVSTPVSPPALSADRGQDPENDGGAPITLAWNAEARDLVSLAPSNPPAAARVYALVSLAQDAALEAGHSMRASRAAEVAASGSVLTYLFPAQEAVLDAMVARDEASLASSPEDVAEVREGDLAGRRIASGIIARARTDGSSNVVTLTIPVGPGYWTGTPIAPQWPAVRPFVLKSGAALRPLPPPPFGSPAFEAALNEVRTLAAGRTAEQLRILIFWNDPFSVGTHSGHWNRIASDLITRHAIGERQAAHVLALMNAAMTDALIACFDAKYTYWLVRPYQVDPSISTPLGKPPHASYPSAHSCTGGAAVGVLGALFQDDAETLSAMELEMGESRLWAGLHYRFDVETGRALGHDVARRVLQAHLVDGEFRRSDGTEGEDR